MNVGQLCNRLLVTAAPDTTARQAAPAPDQAPAAIELVMKQAEALAEGWAGE